MSLVVAFVFLVSSAYASTIVVPNGLDQIPGNSNAVQDPNAHQQWFYAASQFPAAPILINAVAYRLDERVGRPFTYTNPGILFTLSTSRNPLDSISLTFADNVGSDALTVRSGPVTYGSSSSFGSPRPFDIVFPFDAPFLYNPLLGRPLLVEIRSAASLTGEATWDFHFPTDVVRSVAQRGVDSTAGDLVVPQALVTQFSFTVVPEPPAFSLVLFGCGVLALCSIARSKRKQRKAKP